jgi:indolepyruvate ferredoxin oxidoreductase alpha subunit
VAIEKAVLLGNEAIARSVVEAGCEVACAYPGTPSSEILPGIAKFADSLGIKMAVEWATNEKVAFEVAAAASFTGKRSCVAMKHVGLNVAADPFTSLAHFDIEGGLLLIVADDPGHHSSQTEQDSRLFGLFAKIPVFDPSSAREAMEMVKDAYELSEKYHILVMLRPTVRVDHCRQDVEYSEPIKLERSAKFAKDPKRWNCLPANVKINHPRLNQKMDAIRQDFTESFSKYNYEVPAQEEAKLGIIAGGISFAVVMDLLSKMGRKDISVLKIGTPHPLPVDLVTDFIARHKNVLILEETYPVIELQVPDRTNVKGRWNGYVPRAGELVPEVVEEIIHKALGEDFSRPVDEDLKKAIEELKITPKPPMLCPGCPHRASLFAIRKAFPDGIYPSDIGCYTLGVNQKAIDSSICMGASVTQSSGFYLAHKIDGKLRPIIATIGDSTFFHMGLPGLVNAVYNKHAFVLAILDNRITAMTGGQPHPGTGEKLRKGETGRVVPIEGAVRGCGVKFVRTVESYDINKNVEILKEAWEYAKDREEPAVVIFTHPCMLLRQEQPKILVRVNDDTCIGCKFCINFFNCPGLAFDEGSKKAFIDERFCIKCGVCTNVCPHGAIEVISEEGR